MIFFDVTKASASGHSSGLIRVSRQLERALGAAAVPVVWEKWDQRLSGQDWFLTPEIFAADERPGWHDFMAARKGRVGAIFHDAIPLKFPHVTWPQSVSRHPSYMKLLATLDRVWAISKASRSELTGYWRWLDVPAVPRVDVIAWGANFDDRPRHTRPVPEKPLFVCVGIIEPRKNQEFLLEVAESLWAEGRTFELHFVGRLNPHFGAPIARKIAMLQRCGRSVFHHRRLNDEGLADLYRRARATLLPTQAEGCGLPLLESLWMGAPCVCSDLPVLRENADGGGCLTVTVNHATAWRTAWERLLDEPNLAVRLTAEAARRSLPEWNQTARDLLQMMQT